MYVETLMLETTKAVHSIKNTFQWLLNVRNIKSVNSIRETTTVSTITRWPHFFDFHLPSRFLDLREFYLASCYGILVETEIFILNLRMVKLLHSDNLFKFPDFLFFLKFLNFSLTFQPLFTFPDFSLISRGVATLNKYTGRLHFDTSHCQTYHTDSSKISWG